MKSTIIQENSKEERIIPSLRTNTPVRAKNKIFTSPQDTSLKQSRIQAFFEKLVSDIKIDSMYRNTLYDSQVHQEVSPLIDMKADIRKHRVKRFLHLLSQDLTIDKMYRL